MQFIGQQFTNLFHLVDMVVRYEKVIDEENKKRQTNRGTYYKGQTQPANFIEVEDDSQDDGMKDNGYECAIAKIINKNLFICDMLRKPVIE